LRQWSATVGTGHWWSVAVGSGSSRSREGAMALVDAPDFLTMEEAAAILRIGRNQVYELARVWRATGGERGVPVVEFGRLLRVPKAALMRLAGLAEPLGADSAG
jgi:excisionase family DNA binding protein